LDLLNFKEIDVFGPIKLKNYVTKSDWGNEENKSRSNENIGQIEEMNDSLDDTENEDNSDDGESITEVVDTNLPSAGINAILLSTCLALFYVNNNRKKC